MALKTPQIRWTTKQQKELQRTVKNFNAKINRTLKRFTKDKINGVDISISQMQKALPDYIRAGELKQQIRTAKDLKLLTKMYQRFSAKGAEQVIGGATRWQRTEAKRLQQMRNRQSQQVREKYNYDPLKGNTYRFINENVTYSRTDISNFNAKELSRFMGTQLNYLTDEGKHRKDELYRQSFVKHISLIPGLSDANKSKLLDILNNVRSEILRELYFASEYLHIDVWYFPDDQDADELADDAFQEFNEFLQKWVDDGVKVFISETKSKKKKKKKR